MSQTDTPDVEETCEPEDAPGRRKRPSALVKAVTYLARSLVPEARLRRYLTDKEYEAAEIDEVVERLKREGYLNEKLLAETRMGDLAEKRGYWGPALESRMRRDGFSEESRASAIELLEERYRPEELAAAALERRYGARWWEKPEQRVAAYLQRHGFPVSLTVELLQERRRLRAQAQLAEDAEE